jgi:hypothetical protein
MGSRPDPGPPLTFWRVRTRPATVDDGFVPAGRWAPYLAARAEQSLVLRRELR